MQQQRTFIDQFYLFIKGLAMGAANKVPGVSGGVVAFVAGFYEEFIYSLQKFNFKSLLLLFNGRFKSLYQYLNLRFLGVLILGMVFSYFSVSKVLDYFLEHFEIKVWALFFGMIIGSIYYISKDFKFESNAQKLTMLLGILSGIGISLLEPATQNDNLWFVFLCGIISVSGMTLPGLSGSFILILLGNYVLLLVDSVNALYDTISELIRLDYSFLENNNRIRLLKVLGVFTAGSLFGLVSLSHALGYMLKHFKNHTFSFIIGFIAGSLGVVWPWKNKVFKLNEANEIIKDQNGNFIIETYQRYLPDFTSLITWVEIGFIFIGILIVLALIWFPKRNKN
ncbi:DUF368 domain-containing protein [Psychroflexus sp. ALD_RP9]|uniref:DUF368 domain-containing protein n=1 Tax=Psychroflexus sp. ALD_RP9 TaxID=2777186 RepID=UPI001A8DAB11|nr:DUF368 domain-containing protein [Psychroflexus sp. ALD_RP9]QSS97163.1 DUF368 domain-containing protein [Psychroflexus sp. ALD_RP9]